MHVKEDYISHNYGPHEDKSFVKYLGYWDAEKSKTAELSSSSEDGRNRECPAPRDPKPSRPHSSKFKSIVLSSGNSSESEQSDMEGSSMRNDPSVKQQPPKRKRKPKFSYRENLTLMETFVPLFPKLLGLKAPLTESAWKMQAWHNIAKAVSSVGVCNRSIKHVRKRYQDIRLGLRRKMADEKKSWKATGGGPPKYLQFHAYEELLRPLIDIETVIGIPGGFDASCPPSKEPPTNIGCTTCPTPQKDPQSDYVDLVDHLGNDSAHSNHEDQTASTLSEKFSRHGDANNVDGNCIETSVPLAEQPTLSFSAVGGEAPTQAIPSALPYESANRAKSPVKILKPSKSRSRIVDKGPLFQKNIERLHKNQDVYREEIVSRLDDLIKQLSIANTFAEEQQAATDLYRHQKLIYLSKNLALLEAQQARVTNRSGPELYSDFEI